MFKVDGHWLTPGEAEEAIFQLVQGGRLIATDNARKLPLKSGGTTDIYINLRLLRENPAMLRYVAELFANPIRRLRVDRIVEVPEAVSPLAGHLSVITGLPLVTVREEAKQGRVVKGRLIGEVRRGERVAIVDDVVTDAASKLAALRAMKEAGAIVVAIVVLVDRQQGWKKLLAEAGFDDVPIWAAFTLHDMRKYLIQNGIMQRCDPALEAKNPLIVAIDGKPWEEALPLLDRLRPSGCIIKANDLLLEHGIARMVSDLSVYGRPMLDPKWYDIKTTVENYCKRLLATPPWGLTIHASGGREMIQAAVQTLAGTPTIVLTVTLLTSLGAEGEEIYVTQPRETVERLAAIAYEAGARGFVCSTEEAAMLRGKYPNATIVVPALRSPGKDANEQKRTGTFAEAKAAGASNFVGGRQFLTAADPVAEIRRVLIEELGVEL